MRRRQALSLVGGSAVVAMAGCLNSTGGDSPNDGTPEPTVADSSFTVTNVGSGSSNETVDVSFEDGVRITGTTSGSNGCYTAKLAETTYENRDLTLVVEAFEDNEDDQVCTQQLVTIEYEATFEFNVAQPDRVVVEHDTDGDVETVADVKR